VNPQVSIIIAAKDQPETLPFAIQSALRQTLVSEVIVVAGDDTSEAIAMLVARTARDSWPVKIIRDDGACVNAARNVGVMSSSGSYFCFLDSDDELDERFVEKTLTLAERRTTSRPVIVRTYLQEIGDRQGYWDLPAYSQIGNLMSNQFCYSSLQSRDIFDKLGGQSVAHVAWEDWEYWVRASDLDPLVFTVPERLLKYRVWPGNSTHTKHHLDDVARACVVTANAHRYAGDYVAKQAMVIAKMGYDAFARLKKRRESYPDNRMLNYWTTLAEEYGRSMEKVRDECR
jgi:glycosyltransferase involved in cell wall biosynthesis